MRKFRAWSSGLAAALAAGAAAQAHPEGAPWESAPLPGSEGCAACHFDAEPIEASPAIALAGQCGAADADGWRALTLSFAPDAAATVAFMIAAADETSVFEPADEAVEALGALARSTAATVIVEDAPAVWRLRWRAGEEARAPSLHVAANASNDDASPFGDTIHLASFTCGESE